MSEDWQNGGFGLYVHWPFCLAKCPYCDFNSHVSARIDQSQWADAYVSELDRVGRLTEGRVLRSVFFGGGTPSLMEPRVVDRILTKVRETWPTANDMEVTLEANPTSVEAARFEGYRTAGVNRISMGVQALNDADLRRLGRMHTANEAMAAFDVARNIFSRVSFDLIYARQDQSESDWEAELKLALTLAVDHLSLYQLTIEDGTAFGDRYAAGKLRGLPDEDRAANLYEITQSLCSDNGMPAYEVSNHARIGSESIHNLIYWRYGDYAGIGPGAHGRLTLQGNRLATEAVRNPTKWLETLGRESVDTLSKDDQAVEMLLMGLRIVEGVDLQRVGSLIGNKYSHNINRLCEMGMVRIEGGRLQVTTSGRPVLNSVLKEILAD